MAAVAPARATEMISVQDSDTILTNVANVRPFNLSIPGVPSNWWARIVVRMSKRRWWRV
jgi:hypothetical protein